MSKVIAIDIRHTYGDLTGKGIYTYLLLKQLLAQDTENQYLLYSKSHQPPFPLPDNASIKQIKSPSLLWHFSVIRDLKKNPPDIFWAPTSYIIPAHFRSSKTKVVITLHDLVALLFPQNHNKKAIIIEKATIKKAIKNSAHIFAVSHSTADDITNKFAAKNISITPCAASSEFQKIPTTQCDKILAKFHLPPKFILSVGTLEPRKNHIKLIEAFNHLSPKHPDLHLVIAGGKGWQYEQIYETADQNSNIHLIGYVSQSELIALYNRAFLFAFPSLYEGFGIPPLEAMQCGCPVITADTSSLPEVVGDAAITVNPESSEELQAALAELVHNSRLREELITSGFPQSRKFSWENSAQHILETFQKL